MRRKSILKQSTKPEQEPKSAPTSSHKSVSSNSNNEISSAKNHLPTKRSRKNSGDYGTRGIRGLEQTIVIVQKTILRREAPFAESCLPETMKIAFDSRELLFPLLSSYPSSWSFIDKVFVLLTPLFEGNVIKFYKNKGDCLAEIYSSAQLKSFDKLLSRHLLERIETIKLEKEKRV